MTNKKKSDEEWKTHLNDESYYVLDNQEPKDHLQVNIGISTKKGSMFVFAVVHLCLNQKQNLMQAVVGLVFMKLPATIKLMN